MRRAYDLLLTDLHLDHVILHDQPHHNHDDLVDHHYSSYYDNYYSFHYVYYSSYFDYCSDHYYDFFDYDDSIVYLCSLSPGQCSVSYAGRKPYKIRDISSLLPQYGLYVRCVCVPGWFSCRSGPVENSGIYSRIIRQRR